MDIEAWQKLVHESRGIIRADSEIHTILPKLVRLGQVEYPNHRVMMLVNWYCETVQYIIEQYLYQPMTAMDYFELEIELVECRDRFQGFLYDVDPDIRLETLFDDAFNLKMQNMFIN
jgi:hypothetical protein